jgi:FAD/FMN-containing dehydrogenase
VGVAGLTLGGGFGYLARRFGWAVDNLVEVQIVTADGAIRTASRHQEPELFWAIRGGGGNFGVVTRFTFALHEVGPMITGGLMAWPVERADEVLATYRALTDNAPRELTGAVVVRLAPPAPFVPEAWRLQPVIGVLVCHSGPDADADLAPLRALGNPIFDLVAEHPYIDQQSMLDDMDSKGFQQYWKAEYLAELTADYCRTFLDAALRLTSPLSYSVIFHIGGALNERAVDDGAVGNRDARFITGFSGVWPVGVPNDEHMAWVRSSWESIRPFSTGGNYVNFQLADDDDARTAEAYGANLARLRAVKAQYDPTNQFRVNRNISPASSLDHDASAPRP